MACQNFLARYLFLFRTIQELFSLTHVPLPVTRFPSPGSGLSSPISRLLSISSRLMKNIVRLLKNNLTIFENNLILFFNNLTIFFTSSEIFFTMWLTELKSSGLEFGKSVIVMTANRLSGSVWLLAETKKRPHRGM